MPGVTPPGGSPATLGTAPKNPVSSPSPSLNDRWPRLLLNPVFAVAIPNLAGLIDHAAHSAPGLAASYAWFLCLSVSVWEVTRRLYFQRLDPARWLSRPWRRLATLAATIGTGTVPIITVGSAGWAWATGDPSATWRTVLSTTFITVSAVVVIVHVYETTHLIHEWMGDRIRSERLEREKVTAELEMLQREVAPHTLFNMLNALAALIEQRSPDAVRFAEALSHAYRRMLRVRRRPLIDLTEELDLLRAFEALHELRAPGAVRVQGALEAGPAAQIPPMILPELLENAVKHNQASPERPLVVTLAREGDWLVVTNPVRPVVRADSGGVGLRNLNARCRLTTGRRAVVTRSSAVHSIRVPLVAAPGGGTPGSGDATVPR